MSAYTRALSSLFILYLPQITRYLFSIVDCFINEAVYLRVEFVKYISYLLRLMNTYAALPYVPICVGTSMSVMYFVTMMIYLLIFYSSSNC